MTARASLAWAVALAVPLMFHPHPAAPVFAAAVAGPFLVLAAARGLEHVRSRRNVQRTLASVDLHARKRTGGSLSWK